MNLIIGLSLLCMFETNVLSQYWSNRTESFRHTAYIPSKYSLKFHNIKFKGWFLHLNFFNNNEEVAKQIVLRTQVSSTCLLRIETIVQFYHVLLRIPIAFMYNHIILVSIVDGFTVVNRNRQMDLNNGIFFVNKFTIFYIIFFSSTFGKCRNLITRENNIKGCILGWKLSDIWI